MFGCSVTVDRVKLIQSAGLVLVRMAGISSKVSHDDLDMSTTGFETCFSSAAMIFSVHNIAIFDPDQWSFP